jgi:hypothetical protein
MSATNSASFSPCRPSGGTKDSIIDLFIDFTDFKVRHKREQQPSVEESLRMACGSIAQQSFCCLQFLQKRKRGGR